MLPLVVLFRLFRQCLFGCKEGVREALFLLAQGQSEVLMSPSKRLPDALPGQNERLDEENRVRLKEESRQARLREKRREEAKNNIILQVHCLRKKHSPQESTVGSDDLLSVVRVVRANVDSPSTPHRIR